MKSFLWAGALGLIACFLLGTVFPAKQEPEKFFLCVKDIILFSSCDRGLHDNCIFSFINKILQNDIFLLEDEQVIQLGLFQDVCEKKWPQKAMNFVKKKEREQCFLKFKKALVYIHDCMQNYKETMQKKGVFFPTWEEPFKVLMNDLMAMEKIYVKGNKDRMISEFLADLYAVFEFFYRYSRGGAMVSEDFRCVPSFKPCEGLFEVFLSWVSTMFAYDFSIKTPFWADGNKKLFWESIDDFKKPNYFCKKENLFELRKNFCEALFHIPYHIERYKNLLRGDGQTDKQYFLALTMVSFFASEIKKKFVSFFPVKSS